MRASMACPSRLDSVLGDAEWLARCDAQLIGDQVSAGHQLGDGMLHLEPSVDLQERGLRRRRRGGTPQCLRPCTRPPDERQCRPAQSRPQPRRPMARAIPRRPSGVGAAASSRARPGGRRRLRCRCSNWISTWRGLLDVALQDEPLVAERGRRLPPRPGSASGAHPPGSTTCIPLPPPPALGLTAPGSRSVRLASQPSSAGPHRRSRAGSARPARGQPTRRPPCRRAPASPPAAARPRPCPAATTGLGERGVLGQEAVAGVDGIGAGRRAAARTAPPSR